MHVYMYTRAWKQAIDPGKVASPSTALNSGMKKTEKKYHAEFFNVWHVTLLWHGCSWFECNKETYWHAHAQSPTCVTDPSQNISHEHVCSCSCSAFDLTIPRKIARLTNKNHSKECTFVSCEWSLHTLLHYITSSYSVSVCFWQLSNTCECMNAAAIFVRNRWRSRRQSYWS